MTACLTVQRRVALRRYRSYVDQRPLDAYIAAGIAKSKSAVEDVSEAECREAVRETLGIPKPVPVLSCSASSEDTAASAPEPSDPSGGTKCNEDLWPDKDNGLICSDCKVLVTNMRSKYGGTCDSYCKSFGSVCTGSWEDSDDTCADPSETGTCATNWGETSDAICACAHDGTLTTTAAPVFTVAQEGSCGLALDGDPDTDWVTDGQASGAWIQANFAGGAHTIDGMRFTDLCFDSELLGMKEVRLEFSDGSGQSVLLPDSCSGGVYRLNSVSITFVKMVFATTHDRACIFAFVWL